MVADDLTNGEHEEEGTKDGTLRITAHNSTLYCGWMGARSINEDQLVAESTLA